MVWVAFWLVTDEGECVPYAYWLFRIFFIKILFLWVFCLGICLHTKCIPDTHGGHRALDPLGLEFQMVVNHYVGTGN